MGLTIPRGPLRLGRGGGLQIKTGSAFTPASISGLQAWYDWSSASAGTIASQPDLSGNTRTLTAAGTPTGVTNVLNGKSVCRFNGSSDYHSPSFAQPAQWTMIAVANETVAAGIQCIATADDIGSNRHSHHLRFNGSNIDSVAFNTVVTTFTDSQPSTNTSFGVLVAVRDATSIQTWANNVSNGSTATTGTPQTATLALAVGCLATNSNRLTGDIAEVIYYNSALSAANRQLVQTYLATKYGITLS